MFEQLKANTGKTVVIELVNGRKISGKVLSADQQYVRLESDEGTGNIPVQAVYIVWETPSRTLNSENMDEIAEKLRDSVKAEIACQSFPGFTCSQSYICRPPDTCTFSFNCPGSYVPGGGGSTCTVPGGFACTGTQFYGIVAPGPGGQFQPMAGQDPKAEIACTGFPGFSCARSYICRPPDTCTFSFACPGSYAPSFPSGGGACPFFACGSFQFQCGSFQFGQPCGPFTFNCNPFTFAACGSFTFGQPCSPFVFGQQCSPFVFNVPCSPFVFGGSQCGALGGFTCPGAQFFGAPVMPPGGSQCPSPGGFACGGQQFVGLVGMPAGPMAQNPPLTPMELSIKEDSPGEDKKETKE